MIAIVDCGIGNVRSIQNMLSRAGVESEITSEAKTLGDASKLILPGVGNYRFAMESLHERRLVSVLSERVVGARVPTLGICLGAQLMGRGSEEGACEGLNWVTMDTVGFDRNRLGPHGKVPHMGWADTKLESSGLFSGIEDPARFYYVHSYHFRCDDPSMVISTAVHGYPFASGIAHRNIFGVQFHPEKSHAYGQRLLKNFSTLDPLE